MSTYCHQCDGPPWPRMKRLRAGGVPSYFHLCLECGAVREDAHLADGTIIGTRWHTDLNNVSLPDSVVEQAQELLERSR